ncbi:hypothetical protein FRC06_001765 [Ceratobasidium sp. 370]|nr:hypothetical protein FRC06_001765 [Ceratobasidium sp. 370]
MKPRFSFWAGVAAAASLWNMVERVVATNNNLTTVVEWDEHSLFINQQRIFVLSAEFHPWRQPNPDLWPDIFDKIKDNGFNTVSFYTHWALHMPVNGSIDAAEGTYRDNERFIQAAKDAGLWLIARPGPYVNGETTGGGIPAWASSVAGTMRTNNENYTYAWLPYMKYMTELIRKHQITEGGNIILVQAENEFSPSSTKSPYMQAIVDLYRQNGIVVPITHNDQHSGQTGYFAPGTGQGAVDIYCGDSYPQGTSRWNQVQQIYYQYHKAVAPSNPLCLAEFGGGWLLGWGGKPRGGVGYDVFTTDLDNADYENVFYKTNYAQTTTILNIYMLYGGTNWGNTLEPTVYSSYDYGGGINENRIVTAKMPEMRMQGKPYPHFKLAHVLKRWGHRPAPSCVARLARRGPDLEWDVLHKLKSNLHHRTAQSNHGCKTSQGALAIPQTGSMTLNGREAKIVPIDYVFGKLRTRMLYSTAEVMTWTTIDNVDYLVLYAGKNQTGETALVLPSAPQVDLHGSGTVQSTYNSTAGILYLNYALSGSSFVAVGSNLMVVILEKRVALTWHAPVIAGQGVHGKFYGIGSNETVLVGGPYLVRDATISGSTLALSGDLNGTTTIEVVAPKHITTITWNKARQPWTTTAYGSRIAVVAGLSGNITLPKLENWKVINSLPEIDPGFDDSSFVTCDQATTNYTNLPPLNAGPVLYSQQYGFSGGNLIWRGHFNASGAETGFNLTVQGGFAFGFSAWFNGVFLGSSQGSATVSQTTVTWSIPNNTLAIGKDNVLAVLQDHMGLVETTNGGKEPRGIRGYSIIGGSTTFSLWKLAGHLGGSGNNPDKYRGYLNEGGLYAERIGAHLPGFPDSNWTSGTPLAGGGVKSPGVNFYRTTFNVSFPEGYKSDVPLRLSFTPSDITSNYRVQVYLNGWLMGKYINNFGPQLVYVLPSGLLKRKAENTLGLSLWSLDSSGASLAGLNLISDGAFSTSFSFEDNGAAPDYDTQAKRREKPLAGLLPM